MVKYLLFLPQITPLIILLYFLPGYFLTRFTAGRWRNNPLFWIFLSLTFNGPLYTLLALSDKLSLPWWLFSEGVLFLLLTLVNYRIKVQRLTLNDSDEQPKGWKKYSLLAILAVFFVLISLTKWDIFMKRMPIVADDYWQVPKIVSVATSPNVPQHFQYPLTDLSYYYYSYVNPGLLTRFSNNLSQAQRSFTTDFILRLAASLYLIWTVAPLLFKRYLGQLSFILATTFLGGWEYWIGFLSGQKDLFARHLEYWPGAAWLSSMPQISGFTTLFIWAPHHLFAALTLIPIFLLIWRTQGSALLKSLMLSLLIASAVGFSFFAGVAVFSAYLLFSFLTLVLKKNAQSLGHVLLTSALTVVWLIPFFLIIGWRESKTLLSVSHIDILSGSGLLTDLANFFISLPLYYFLDLGVLLIGLVSVIPVIKNPSKLTGESVFWLACLLPLFAVLLLQFPSDNEFVARSRTTVPALIALAVFTGLVLDRINRRVGWLLLAFYCLTGLTTLSEIKQNLRPTPRTYTFYSQLDEVLPLDSVIFADIRAANDYYWLVPLFIHRMVVKPSSTFDMVDRQYTGYDPFPADGLLGDDLPSVQRFLVQHTDLRSRYGLFYLTKTEHDLPLVAQDLDYRLYRLSSRNRN